MPLFSPSTALEAATLPLQPPSMPLFSPSMTLFGSTLPLRASSLPLFPPSMTLRGSTGAPAEAKPPRQPRRPALKPSPSRGGFGWEWGEGLPGRWSPLPVLLQVRRAAALVATPVAPTGEDVSPPARSPAGRRPRGPARVGPGRSRRVPATRRPAGAPGNDDCPSRTRRGGAGSWSASFTVFLCGSGTSPDNAAANSSVGAPGGATNSPASPSRGSDGSRDDRSRSLPRTQARSTHKPPLPQSCHPEHPRSGWRDLLSMPRHPHAHRSIRSNRTPGPPRVCFPDRGGACGSGWASRRFHHGTP